MIIRMMYVLPLILGRTYDMKTNSVGIDIFPAKALQDPRVIEESFYSSNFKTVETLKDVKEVLGIKGDLSLGIKAGLFTFRGMGSYLKDTMNVQNAVDILTKVSFRTVSKSLPLSAKPITSWFSMGKEYLGTHFVRSILYGGDLIACVRFKAVKSEYLQDIKATIKSSLGAGNALDLVGEGKLESLDKKLKNNATMEINYYATVPLHGVPNTIKGLRDLITNFEKHVAKENNGLGVPVEVELDSLSSLNQGFSYIKNTELETELKLFEENLDDLLTTKSRTKAWISTLPDTLSEEHQKLISDFSERVSSILRKFIQTIGDLNPEKGSSQLDEANEAYRENKKFALPGKFNQALNKLQRKIVLSKENQEDRGSSSYIHYGASQCSKEECTSTVFSGYIVSSSRNVSGAGFNFLCFPKVTTRNTNQELEADTSKIAGVKYGLLIDKPFEINEDAIVLRGAVCAVCLVKRRPTTLTFLGQSKCPEGGEWILQYSGFIMASTDANKSQNICVDSRHESHHGDPGYSDQSLNFVVAEHEKGNNFISCVVCSK